jgi:peptidoglycan hydrolase-like protein with peptidoglycan-binding domain
MAYATNEMMWLAHAWENAVGSAVFSGIVGDRSHTYGYHRAANEISSSDYSRQLSGDKVDIDVNAADAIDMSHSDADMKTITKRLFDSWKDVNDPRLDYWREIIGTLDGRNVIYMDTQSGHQGTADNSHLWHIHAGGLRHWVHSQHAMEALLSIITGETWASYFARTKDPIGSSTPAPAPPPPPPSHPRWPGRVLRLTSPLMVGLDVRQWQSQMHGRGWTISVDGYYGTQSRNVCRAFQEEKHLQVDGEVGPQTWDAAWIAPKT